MIMNLTRLTLANHLGLVKFYKNVSKIQLHDASRACCILDMRQSLGVIRTKDIGLGLGFVSSMNDSDLCVITQPFGYDPGREIYTIDQKR